MVQAAEGSKAGLSSGAPPEGSCPAIEGLSGGCATPTAGIAADGQMAMGNTYAAHAARIAVPASNGNALPHNSSQSHGLVGTDSSDTEHNLVSNKSSNAAAGSSSNGVPTKASNTAVAMKRELDGKAESIAKRQKILSKESQAAMAVIAATARLPSQVTACMCPVQCPVSYCLAAVQTQMRLFQHEMLHTLGLSGCQAKVHLANPLV